MTNLNVVRQERVNCNDQFLLDIYEGLSLPQKSLPCKYFYDEKGAELFDQICQTPEYYHTRTELKIFEEALPVVAGLVGPSADILEFGSGAGIKIRTLINALDKPRSYCPIDISEEMLLSSSHELQQIYPELEVLPIVADYHSHITLPAMFSESSPHRKLVFFPGSTISNFDMPAAMHFLKHIRKLLEPEDALLIGVDLIKPVPKLLAAYNDAQGITAAFNKNMLTRICNTYETDLDPDQFYHHAIYNAEEHRIEMHLVSKTAQRIRIEDESFNFEERESIHTENSYKYSIEGFRMMALNAGFDSVDYFTDDKNLFSVHYLTASKSRL
jgi:dimethylhistidine N-methyltransferase